MPSRQEDVDNLVDMLTKLSSRGRVFGLSHYEVEQVPNYARELLEAIIANKYGEEEARG